MSLLFALVLAALPAPFDNLVDTVLWDHKVFTRPGALKPLKDCNPRNTPCHLVELDAKGPTVCVGFDEGPSDDPTFVLLPRAACGKPLGTMEPLLEIGATTLIIPGNGFVYATGHTNNYVDARRKFELSGGKLREVKQPFYAVGGGPRRVQRTPLMDEDDPVQPIILRSERRDDAPVVATVPAGGEVEVLLSDGPDTGWFLVRTAVGLVGWYHSPSGGTMPDTLGIYFHGD